MIGTKETLEVYKLPPHYIQMLINSVVSKRGIRSMTPVIGDKISAARKPKGGITLLGGRIGQGKTSTINIFIDAFEKDASLSGVRIAYLHTLQINGGKSNFVDEAGRLMTRYKPEKLVVIIDQIDCYESMKAGILLAKLGYTVLGVVGVESDIHISNVLKGAIKGVPSEYEAMLLRIQLLENLRALITQDQNYPMRVQFLKLDKNTAKTYIETLKKNEMPYLCKDIDNSDKIAVKHWDAKNWNKKQ